jgi:hypothetical protein
MTSASLHRRERPIASAFTGPCPRFAGSSNTGVDAVAVSLAHFRPILFGHLPSGRFAAAPPGPSAGVPTRVR